MALDTYWKRRIEEREKEKKEKENEKNND